MFLIFKNTIILQMKLLNVYIDFILIVKANMTNLAISLEYVRINLIIVRELLCLSSETCVNQTYSGPSTKTRFKGV